MDDRITDQPPGPSPWGAGPPWERSGAFRLDAEPHRGHLLSAAATAVLALELAGFLALSDFSSLSANVAMIVSGLVVVFPVALASALAVWKFARQDLGRMRKGRMDPRGAPLTASGKSTGAAAAGVAIRFGLAWAGHLVGIFFLDWTL